MVYPGPAMYAPRKKGRGWGFLGFLVAVAILFFTFSYGPQAYTTEQAGMIALGAIFIGGFITRRGKGGAILGFVLLFVPLLIIGILLFAAGISSGSGGDYSEGIPGIAQAFGEALGRTLIVAIGLVLIIASFILGAVGAVIGGIAGWISGKIFPLEREDHRYAYAQNPEQRGFPPPPPR
ncbi:MAG: hypothetical protein ACE5HJ_08665 [Thermoplasmata archaeon]